MAFIVGQRLIDPKTLPVTICLSFLLLLLKLVASDNYLGFTEYRCVLGYNETSNNQTDFEPLMNSLTAIAYSSSLSFYNTTTGKSPHKSYGMYYCRGDATPQICRSCVANTTNDLLSFNAAFVNCTDFVAFADYCTLRLANYSFFGKASDEDLGWQPGQISNTISQVYKRVLEGAVENVTKEAANNGTSFFATTEAAVDGQEKVYALAQCSPDISKGECIGCLKAAAQDLIHNSTGYLKGVWMLLPSCQLKTDNSSFFGGSTTATSKPEATIFLVIAFTMFIIGIL